MLDTNIEHGRPATLDILVGSRVLTKVGDVGSVRFMGPISGREGWWVGIELDEPRGINNGMANGTRYSSVVNGTAYSRVQQT